MIYEMIRSLCPSGCAGSTYASKIENSYEKLVMNYYFSSTPLSLFKCFGYILFSFRCDERKVCNQLNKFFNNDINTFQ